LCTENNLVGGRPQCACREGFEMQKSSNEVYSCIQCPPGTFKAEESFYSCANWTAPVLLKCEKNQYISPGTSTKDRICVNSQPPPDNAMMIIDDVGWTCNKGFQKNSD
jgi:hypothetical protein